MSDYKKYLKYKKKYLELKKKLNYKKYINQKGGLIVKTISNDGELEGMTFQCFWISILDYLKRHGYPDLTLHDLREFAGLGPDTEHIPFDSDYLEGPELNRQPIFLNAANQIADLYDLCIKIYSIDEFGQVKTNEPNPRATIGRGTNLVEIAQYGIVHFELIDKTYGDEFEPAVIVKGELKKDISDSLKEKFIELNNKEDLLKTLKNDLKANEISYEDVIKSGSLETRRKQLNYIGTNIEALENNISKLDDEIDSLRLKIQKELQLEG